jgi:metal-sulfur cluster biosynthetic enzyme
MTPPTEEALLDALRSVDDPEAGMNIVELGLVYGVEATPDRNAPARWIASVRMTMTSAACPLGDLLTDAVRDALRACFPELETVNVELVWDPPWTPERMTEEARNFFGWK